MADEDTTKLDASSNENQADGFVKKEDGTGGGDSSSNVDEKVDYKALLAETKDQLKKAEYKIIDLKRNKNVSSTDDDDSDDDEDDDGGKEDVLKLVDEKLNELKQGQVSDTIADTLADMTDDPSERELIALIYDKKLVKSGYSKQSILSDLETARLIANKGRIQKSSKELEAKKKSDQGKQSGNSGSGQRSQDDASSGDEIQLSRKDQEIMKRFGLTTEDIIKNSNR
jgi:hypothetical protein